MSKKTSKHTLPVVISTDKRGVFFGYIDPETIRDKTIRVERARMCVRWSAETGGFTGLAGAGPGAGSCIAPECPAITLHGVESVSEASPEAVERWSAL